MIDIDYQKLAKKKIFIILLANILFLVKSYNMFNNKVKAVISDLDGVIVNSFENFYNAYKQLLGEKGIKDFPLNIIEGFSEQEAIILCHQSKKILI